MIFPDQGVELSQHGDGRGLRSDALLQSHCPACPQLLNMGARRPPPRKIIMNLSVNDDVQLKKSENAWKPGLKRESSADDPETLRTQVGAG